MMLVLIGVAPAGFVVNMNASGCKSPRARDAVNNVETYFQQHLNFAEKKATGVDQLIRRLKRVRPPRRASSTTTRQTRLTRWNVRKACWAISRKLRQTGR